MLHEGADPGQHLALPVAKLLDSPINQPEGDSSSCAAFFFIVSSLNLIALPGKRHCTERDTRRGPIAGRRRSGSPIRTSRGPGLTILGPGGASAPPTPTRTGAQADTPQNTAIPFSRAKTLRRRRCARQSLGSPWLEERSAEARREPCDRRPAVRARRRGGRGRVHGFAPRRRAMGSCSRRNLSPPRCCPRKQDRLRTRRSSRRERASARFRHLRPQFPTRIRLAGDDR